MTFLSQKNKNKQDGQVILLSVVIIGGVLLSAAAIAGLLTIYQVRSANDIAGSARAFFAADAALEWQSYQIEKKALFCTRIFVPVSFSFLVPNTSSSAACDEQANEIIVRAQGFAGDSARALETVFSIQLGQPGGGGGGGGGGDNGGNDRMTLTVSVPFYENVEGRVVSDPPGISCNMNGGICIASFPRGELVKLNAEIGNGGSQFESWGGACAGTVPLCTLTMDTSQSVSAIFKEVIN